MQRQKRTAAEISTLLIGNLSRRLPGHLTAAGIVPRVYACEREVSGCANWSADFAMWGLGTGKVLVRAWFAAVTDLQTRIDLRE